MLLCVCLCVWHFKVILLLLLLLIKVWMKVISVILVNKLMFKDWLY